MRTMHWPSIDYVYRKAAHVHDNDWGASICRVSSLFYSGHTIIYLQFVDGVVGLIYMIDSTRARRSILITQDRAVHVLSSAYPTTACYQINALCERLYAPYASSLRIDHKVNMKRSVRQARAILNTTRSMYKTARHLMRPNVVSMMVTLPREMGH